MQTLDHIARRAALACPDKVAIVDGGIEWTWAEFDAQINRSADALRTLGLAPGDRVAAAAVNSAAYFALYYGAARLGAVLCPLNYLLTVVELEHVVGDFAPTLALVEPEFTERVEPALAACAPTARLVGFGPDGEWATCVAAADPTATFEPVDPDSVHLVMYTSGTTGFPKGACHTQRAHYLDGLCAAVACRIRPDDRYVVHAPSFHVASWDHAKHFLVADGSVTVLPSFDAGEVLHVIERDRATVFFGVPSVLERLASHPDFGQRDLSSLRTVYYGGGLMSGQMLRDFAARLDRDIDFIHLYGLTEAGPFVSFLPPERALDKTDSIGSPMPGVEMRIADPQSGATLPDGEVGEIVVRAPSVMLGYLNRDDATAAALRNGWLHTGDLGRRDDEGDFYIVDRLKDMIKTGGENVYAREVERALLEHEHVLEAAAVGVPDEKWGEMVVAVLRGAAELEPDALKPFLRERLAAYKVPKHFLVVDEFPRTGQGKIAKQELREHVREQLNDLADVTS